MTTGGPRREIEPAAAPPHRREARLTRLAQQRLLHMLAPSAVLINGNWRVLYICGEVDNYLMYKAGVPTDNLLEIAHCGLRTKLRGAVHTALSEGRTVTAEARVQTLAGAAPVTLTIRVIKDGEQEEGLVLVLIEKSGVGFQPAEQEREKPAKKSKKQKNGKLEAYPTMTSTVLSRTVSGAAPQAEPIETLTDRQLEVFRLIGDGLSARQIANRMHISVHTVETHRENIKRKLRVNTVSELTHRTALWISAQRRVAMATKVSQKVASACSLRTRHTQAGSMRHLLFRRSLLKRQQTKCV